METKNNKAFLTPKEYKSWVNHVNRSIILRMGFQLSKLTGPHIYVKYKKGIRKMT